MSICYVCKKSVDKSYDVDIKFFFDQSSSYIINFEFKVTIDCTEKIKLYIL